MKIDMTQAAITLRLKQAAQLRAACLSLSRSSKSLEIQKKHPDNPLVKRTSNVLGR